MSVRELFKSQLRSAELLPDAAFEKKLMRELSHKEFVRFNPYRFNIYYAGAIIVVTILTGLVIFSPEKVKDDTVINSEADSLLKSVTGDSVISLQQGSVLRIKPIPRLQADNRMKADIVTESVVVKDAELFKADETGNNRITQVDIPLKGQSVTAENTDGLRLPVSSEIPGSAFSMSVSEGCLPLKVRFVNESVHSDSCVWMFGDGGSSNELNPEWIFDEEGVYRVGLTVFGSSGQRSVSFDSLTVHRKPQALFEVITEDINSSSNEIRLINFSSDAVVYRWYFGDGVTSDEFEPEHRYSAGGRYNVTLVVGSESGCTDSLIVENAISASTYFIYYPNAFIPNAGGPSGGLYSSKSDETAEVFHPVCSEIGEYQLRIFSKMGILIFESNDVNIGWDGYYKGQLSEPGVYIWKVRGKFSNGEPFVKMGDVTILRN